jgi:hypothetical protein
MAGQVPGTSPGLPPGYDQPFWPYYLPVPFGPNAVSVQLFGGDVLIGGLSVREASGVAPATFELRDGSDANGVLFLSKALNAGQSDEPPLPGFGVVLTRGLFLVVLAGNVTGSVWVCDL